MVAGAAGGGAWGDPEVDGRLIRVPVHGMRNDPDLGSLKDYSGFLDHL